MSLPELAIVGAGPVGIELAAALKRGGIPFLHFEAKQIGSTMGWWAPGTRWFSSNERISIAGVPLRTADQTKATREDYLNYLRAVVEQFDLDIRTFHPVRSIAKDADGAFTITVCPLSGEQKFRAKRVALVTGGTARPRLIGIPGEDLPHVSHYLMEPHLYFRRRVLIVGGKNSAAEAAMRCHNAGAAVTLSYRGAELDGKVIKYWIYPELMSLIRNGKIRAHFNTRPERITADHVALRVGAGPAAGSSFNVPADAVLLLTGYVADMSLAESAGVALTGPRQTPQIDESTMQTNIPGLYIAGTAVGGTQENYKVFLENCHIHVDRILASITGDKPPANPETHAIAET